MRRIAPLAALCLGLACYTDDTGGPTGGRPLTPVVQVHVTDDPFPFDSVASVNIYIDSIEASTASDSAGYLAPGGAFVTIAAPHRAVNLLDFTQGAAELLGQGTLQVGQYKSVRVIMDVDSSSILWSGGIPMTVEWGTTGRIQLNAVVKPVFSVADSGADLVIDFDVGRSFPFNQLGQREFDFSPYLRAVNSAETGSIDGTVTDTLTPGSPQPVPNANVDVIQQSSAQPIASARTDASGHYKVAFLPPDVYQVRVEQPIIPALRTTLVSDVHVTKQQNTPLSVVMASFGAQPASIHITGPSVVGVGGHIVLQATVTDSQGNPVANPVITWKSSNPSIATTEGNGLSDSTFGVAAGTAMIYASTSTLTDSLLITVDTAGGSDSVATVLIATAYRDSMPVGDSIGFFAYVQDSTGAGLSGRSITWSVSDSTVISLFGLSNTTTGSTVYVRALKAGSASLQATSEGKSNAILIKTY